MRPGNHPRSLPWNLPVPLDFIPLLARSFGQSVPTDCGLSTSELAFGRSFSAYSNLALTPFDLTPVAAGFRYAAMRTESNEISSVRLQLILRILDVTRLFQSLFLGASPRFRGPEGGKAVPLRIDCRYRSAAGISALAPIDREWRSFRFSGLHPAKRALLDV